jgi:hypothetical protein
MIWFFLGTVHSQAFSQRRGALHKVAPQPLLRLKYLGAVTNVADGAIGAQLVSGIHSKV